MFSIKQPNHIVIGNGSAHNFQYPKNSLLITSKGAKSRGWIEYLDLDKNVTIYDQVENNPSMDTVKKILEEFSNSNFSCIIGLGGGSCLDVAKYLGYELKKNKILIPTTFGSGSEVTRISVLKINGKKKSFHNDDLIANVAIEDVYFLKNTPREIFNNSVIDSCAQATEAYDSKNSNPYTKILGRAYDWKQNLNSNTFWYPLDSYIVGEKNTERYDDYFRIDVGMIRKGGNLFGLEYDTFWQIMNLTRHLNILTYQYRTETDPLTGDQLGVERRATPMFPLIFTFGVKFEF